MQSVYVWLFRFYTRPNDTFSFFFCIFISIILSDVVAGNNTGNNNTKYTNLGKHINAFLAYTITTSTTLQRTRIYEKKKNVQHTRFFWYTFTSFIFLLHIQFIRYYFITQWFWCVLDVFLFFNILLLLLLFSLVLCVLYIWLNGCRDTWVYCNMNSWLDIIIIIRYYIYIYMLKMRIFYRCGVHDFVFRFHFNIILIWFCYYC